MDDSLDSGDNGDEQSESSDRPRMRAGLADVVDPNAPGWESTIEAAVDVAWKSHHRAGNGPAVYKADIYVKGENPISGYKAILSP